MVRSPRFALIVALALVTCAAPSHSQQDSGSSSQSQNPPLTTPQEQAQRSVSAKPGAKKTKKVWTNENLSDAGGTISVVGDTRNAPKGPARTDQRSSSDNAVDPRAISGLRQQLEKLQAQLADVDRQLADLKDFSKGSSKGSGGIQRNTWEYNSSSVDEQLRTLQANRNQIQAAIDSVYDNARKRGIEPGQLR